MFTNIVKIFHFNVTSFQIILASMEIDYLLSFELESIKNMKGWDMHFIRTSALCYLYTPWETES